MEALNSFIVMHEGVLLSYLPGDDVPDDVVAEVAPGPRKVIFGEPEPEEEEFSDPGDDNEPTKYDNLVNKELIKLLEQRNITAASTRRDDLLTALRMDDAAKAGDGGS